MFREWREGGIFESTDQRVCDQARAIRKNGWFSDAELDAIKAKVENKPESQIYIKQKDIVEIEPVETVIEIVKELVDEDRNTCGDCPVF